MKRKVKRAMLEARYALFAADYYRYHGMLPVTLSKTERRRLRDREMAAFPERYRVRGRLPAP